jgi:PilZ domain
MPEWNDLSNRRAAPRYPCRASSCRFLRGIPWKVEVRDISALGIGLLCEGPVQPGELLSLHLSGACIHLAVALQTRVVHAEVRSDGCWLAGCIFDPPLPTALVTKLHALR